MVSCCSEYAGPGVAINKSTALAVVGGDEEGYGAPGVVSLTDGSSSSRISKEKPDLDARE